MVLPFVREFFADVEKSSAFTRLPPHLREGAGRASVSGLTPTAKALLIALLQRTAARPVIVVTRGNREAEDLTSLVQAFCELTAGPSPETVISLPTRDVLPFQNLSPHPEIQEARAIALWKIASGAAQIVIAPGLSSAMRLRSAEYYAGQARIAHRGETIDAGELVQHLNSIGYNSVDVVEMPGEYAVRGGILDVYPAESDRPLRVEFFGDEIESIRKFDPGTQRSSAEVDEAVLLPLTDTPVTEEVLAAVHARLSGKRISGAEDIVEEAVRAGGVSVFPGWEFYAPLAGAGETLLDLLPGAAVLVDEPADVHEEFERYWERIEQSHERSGIGNLVRPEDLYLPPDSWKQGVAVRHGIDLEHLGVLFVPPSAEAV